MNRSTTAVLAAALSALGAQAHAMPQTMALSITDPLTAGAPATITVTGAFPSTSLTLVQSDGAIAPGICLPALGGECLDITSGPSGYQVVPVPLVADAAGTAVWTGPIPPALPDGLAWVFQAVDVPNALGSVPVAVTTLRDGDGDGCRDGIDPSPGVASPDVDGDGFGSDCDCDPIDPASHPGALELCDGFDNDCDGMLGPREGDVDGDGYLACDDDCDDDNPAAYPGAPVLDACDAEDLDCSGGPNAPHVPLTYATVQAAVDATPSGGLVCVGAGTWVENVAVGAKSITLLGEGQGVSILDGGGAGSVLTLGAGSSTLEGLTVQNGLAATGAGISAITTQLTLRDVTIRDNACNEVGICGAVGLHAQQGSVDLDNVDVLDNTATSTASSAIGVGIYLLGGVNTLDQVTVQGNTADAFPYGVGIYLDGGIFTLNDVLVAENTATDETGGVGVGMHIRAASVDMDRVDVRANEAFGLGDFSGTGIYADTGSTLDLTNVVVAGNVAWNGGACSGVGLTTLDSTVTATNANITGNGGLACAGSGLGWYSSADALDLDNVTIDQNESLVAGGGGIQVVAPTSLVTTYTNAWGNTGGNWIGVADPTGTGGNISVAPTYVSYGVGAMTWDLRPTAGSPLVDAGDPALLDPDASRSDIGAYGGPGGAW